MCCVGRLYSKCLVVFCCLFAACFSASAQLTVTPGLSAAALSAMLAGPGIAISSPVLHCAGVANGSFSVAPGTILGTGTTVFGIGNGVLLTTGKATAAAGTEATLASTNNSAAGDADLVTLSGATTYDACVLEFDVTPTGDTIKFNYIFGSEEYVNSTCGPYNDAFAFFISGPGITGIQNMALVPGTSIPVTVNSVNSGTPGPGYTLDNCTAMGAGSPFTGYFTNNTGGTRFTYKGFTTSLTALHNVIPCNTYHLKLAIADAGNTLYDSGVFIEAASLTTPVISGVASVCIGGSITLSYTAPGGTWSSSNAGVASVDVASGVVTGISVGTAMVTYSLPGGCFITKDITVGALPPITGVSSVCAGAAITLGNATTGGTWSSVSTGIATADAASGIVTGVAAGTTTISYVTGSDCTVTAVVTVNPAPATITGITAVCIGQTSTLSNIIPGGSWLASNAAVATIDAGTGVVTAITAGPSAITYSLAGGCFATVPFTVYPLPSRITAPAILCVGFTVTLSDTVTGGTWSANDPAVATIDAASGAITGLSVGSVLVTYTAPGGCTVTELLPVQLIAPQLTIAATDTVLCSGAYATFTGFAGGDPVTAGYNWQFDAGAPNTANPVLYAFADEGMHTVTLNYRPEGCPTESISRNVLVYPSPVINLGHDTSICPGSNSIILTDYLNADNAAAHWIWSTGESASAIAITAPGYYYARVTVNGCFATDTVWVQNDCYLDVPNAFTPNGDGVNDYFFPREYLSKGLITFHMSIYNRWGNLLFETTALNGRGWDGRFNDILQPEGVYVYIIQATFKDGEKENHEGNVTLLK